MDTTRKPCGPWKMSGKVLLKGTLCAVVMNAVLSNSSAGQYGTRLTYDLQYSFLDGTYSRYKGTDLAYVIIGVKGDIEDGLLKRLKEAGANIIRIHTTTGGIIEAAIDIGRTEEYDRISRIKIIMPNYGWVADSPN